MAELFVQQGQPGRALAIYRKLASERPNDPEIQRRLDELSARRGGAMSFHEQIQRIVDNTPGALAATIMGFDGIPIDTYEKRPGAIDVSTLLTEYSSAVQQVRGTAESLGYPGAITEIDVASENLVAVLRQLTPDLFLGVVLERGSLPGKARYLMRVAAPAIMKELL